MFLFAPILCIIASTSQKNLKVIAIPLISLYFGHTIFLGLLNNFFFAGMTAYVKPPSRIIKSNKVSRVHKEKIYGHLTMIEAVEFD
ncbi:unnamed protein product [Sphenostylis stenocarpa]|uniref:Uncharacterized protein n=1 Tax=Sphenostylis stenocarpa TaxID=92480 RepID=A0AA86RL13_9FABA|nr:unnamed protein product [Sphenostylis stenocarpa]